MIRLSVIFLLFAPYLQCLNAQEIISRSIIHDDIIREYHVYVPNTYYSGNPLLMNFHGSGNTGLAQMFYGNFMEIADTEGFLILSPEGTLDTEGFSHWNVGFATDSNVDDVGFVDALLDSLYIEYSYDLKRVYSTGMSNGGFLSYLLACEMSNKIAAIASVTGSMTLGLPSNCNCMHPMPVMQIHGTTDPVVPYDGGGLYTSIEDLVNFWITFNSIPNLPEVSLFPDISTIDGSTAEKWLYQNTDTSVDLALIRIIGGGHTWPGATAPTEDTNYDINASVEIWNFLSKYQREDGIVALNDQVIQTTQSSLYFDYGSQKLFIDWKNEATDFQIFNQSGKLIQVGQLSKGIQSFSLRTKSEGMNFLVTECTTLSFFR